MKKPLQITFGILFICCIVLSTSWWQSFSKADLLSESLSNKFHTALVDNDIDFFTILSPNDAAEFSETVLTPFPRKMDIVTLEDSSYLFFSFLGLQDESSVLKPMYGVWNPKYKSLTHSPAIMVSIMQQSEKYDSIHQHFRYTIPCRFTNDLTPKRHNRESIVQKRPYSPR